MKYEILVLDLDGTLTDSEKKITPPTKEALLDIQANGKKVVLASGRPTQGILPLAEELKLKEFGSYILSYNGGKIIDCATGKTIYSRPLPTGIITRVLPILKAFPVDLLTYTDTTVISAIAPNKYTHLEGQIIHNPVVRSEDVIKDFDQPRSKFLVAGEPMYIPQIEPLLKREFRGLLNIYQSAPFFLEIMQKNIDKAHSLQKLLNSIGLTANQMICCGDGHNDISMIEYAGLGVAMANAQPLVLECADYVTRSNDEDGVLHVINEFMR